MSQPTIHVKKLASTIFLSAISCSLSSAATIVSYDFAGGSVSTTTTDGATGSDITFGAFTGGASAPSVSGTSNVVFARTNATGAATGDGDSLADAITNANYATITVTAGANDIALESFEFNYWFTSGFGGGDFRTYVTSDIAGFTDGNEHGFGQVLDNSRPNAGAQVLEQIDISSLGTLGSGNSVEFRIYFTDNSTASNRIHRVDDVAVIGTIIPEPSTALLGGLAFLGLLRRHR